MWTTNNESFRAIDVETAAIDEWAEKRLCNRTKVTNDTTMVASCCDDVVAGLTGLDCSCGVLDDWIAEDDEACNESVNIASVADEGRIVVVVVNVERAKNVRVVLVDEEEVS